MHQHFFRNYEKARQHFIRSCDRRKLTVDSHKHPGQGPDGDIFMDVACFGDPAATRVVVISSGTHGIEGYSGSGLQSMLLHEGLTERIPNNTRVLLVHAVNPYGFAWQRRTNESNIDLNRNFVDFENLPVNEDYREIASIFEPESWDANSRQIQEEVRSVVQSRGLAWYQGALTRGQYEYPEGMFYGGTTPAWSNQTIHRVARDHLASASEIVWIDIHTALGPFGTAECIVDYATDSEQYQRSVSFWGDRVKSAVSGDSYSAHVSGSMIAGISNRYPALVGAGLEFGTRPVSEVIQALIADQWLHRYGQVELEKALKKGVKQGAENGHPIKDMMMDAFYPDSIEWRESIANIAREVVEQALEG